MAETEMNGVPNEFQKKLFDRVEAKQWAAVSDFIISEAATFADISKPNDYGLKKTILHYACNDEKCKDAVKTIFTIIDSFKTAPTQEELKEFVNATDSSKRSALQIAIGKAHDDAIKILLDRNADTSIEVCKELLLHNSRYRKVLLDELDHGLKIHNDQFDPTNQDHKTVSCNFKVITGDTENKLETQGLSRILCLAREIRFPLLNHPLTQMFIDAKCEKYKWWIWFSMTYHILWYSLIAIFLIGTPSNIPLKNLNDRITNLTELDPISNTSLPVDSPVTDLPQKTHNDANWIASSSWFLFSFYTYFFITMIKEIVEFMHCPNRKFYFRQVENWGQVALFIVAIFAAIVSRLGELSYWEVVGTSIVYSVGMVASLLLIQGQFTKSQRLGIHNQMMMKSFKRLVPFLCTFLPLLCAITVILHLLIPDELPTSVNTFIVKATKMLGVLSGELNMNDVYTKDNIKDVSFVIKTFFVYTLLILVVVILFLNLWIANTVNDIEKLKTLAIAAHYASRLEVVNILEACLCRISYKFGKRYSVLKVQDIKAKPTLRIDLSIKFNKIPSQTRKLINENMSRFNIYDDNNT